MQYYTLSSTPFSILQQLAPPLCTLLPTNHQSHPNSAAAVTTAAVPAQVIPPSSYAHSPQHGPSRCRRGRCPAAIALANVVAAATVATVVTATTTLVTAATVVADDRCTLPHPRVGNTPPARPPVDERRHGPDPSFR